MIIKFKGGVPDTCPLFCRDSTCIYLCWRPGATVFVLKKYLRFPLIENFLDSPLINSSQACHPKTN